MAGAEDLGLRMGEMDGCEREWLRGYERRCRHQNIR
jgi:hypothetical protein